MPACASRWKPVQTETGGGALGSSWPIRRPGSETPRKAGNKQAYKNDSTSITRPLIYDIRKSVSAPEFVQLREEKLH
jgi:hypothetical protein